MDTLSIGGLAAALLLSAPAIRRADAAGVEERAPRPRKLTESEARQQFPGFQRFVTDTDDEADPAEFAAWCIEQGMYQFHGFPCVWRQYEIFCWATGTVPMAEGAFQRRFNRIARSSRGGPIKGTQRPHVYDLPAPRRRAA